MKQVADFTDTRLPHGKVSIMLWNNRYLIKFEQDGLEQTYKIEQLEFRDHEEVKALAKDFLLEKAAARFQEMMRDFVNCIDKLRSSTEN